MCKSFAVFICTHGRPHKQHTLDTLRSCGYTGIVYLLVDDEDCTVDELSTLYSDEITVVTMFNKQHYIDTVDIGRKDALRKAILYAKCAAEDKAKEFSLDTFCIVDDDIISLRYRYFDGEHLLTQQITSNLDEIFDAYTDFILEGNVCMTSFGTNQMFMGGNIPDEKKGEYRVPYNFLFRNTSIPFNWVSEMNEDTISPVLENKVGTYTIQLPFIKLEMLPPAAGADGGMSELYSTMSAFERISVMVQYLPSCIKYLFIRGTVTQRLSRENAYPKLVSDRYLL